MPILRTIQLLLFIALHTTLFAQKSKADYLSRNATALSEHFVLPEKNIKVIGFGAYHGSAKTEDAELLLIQSLIKNNNLRYYIAETDISVACYLNKYLDNGDENLLKDLIETYGTRVPQERTIEVFDKWKKLKALNDRLPKKKKITILGADPIVTYKYTYRHLMSLITKPAQWDVSLQLQETIARDTTDFSPYYDSFSKNQLKAFVADYDANTKKYQVLINDKPMFEHLISTIKVSFGEKYRREKEMYNNYLTLVNIYKCKDKVQFFRLGFSHLLKAKAGKEDRGGSFFSMLADNNIYPKNQIVSIIGYLTSSNVIWKDKYNEEGEYVSSVTMGDEGIGDSESEYFKGIQSFKESKKGDLTIFKLNMADSPYNEPGCTDMVEVISKEKPIDYGTSSTTNFLDYVLLISNSAASRSIYSFKNN